jgi:hypothetical protein
MLGLIEKNKRGVCCHVLAEIVVPAVKVMMSQVAWTEVLKVRGEGMT